MALLDASLLGMQGRLNADDYSEYKGKVSKVMGEITWEVLADVFRRFPDLDPKDADAWRKAGQLDARDWLGISDPRGPA